MALGTFLLAGVGITLGGIAYYSNKKDNVVNLEDLSSEKEKYEEDKWIIEDAINKQDIKKLKRLLNVKSIIKYDDLQQIVKDALKKYND